MEHVLTHFDSKTDGWYTEMVERMDWIPRVLEDVEAAYGDRIANCSDGEVWLKYFIFFFNVSIDNPVCHQDGS